MSQWVSSLGCLIRAVLVLLLPGQSHGSRNWSAWLRRHTVWPHRRIWQWVPPVSWAPCLQALCSDCFPGQQQRCQDAKSRHCEASQSLGSKSHHSATFYQPKQITKPVPGLRSGETEPTSHGRRRKVTSWRGLNTKWEEFMSHLYKQSPVISLRHFSSHLGG